jgi:predicted Na+-dependent transporter
MIANRHFEDKRVMLAVVLFLLVSIVVSALYAKWMTRRVTAQHAQPAVG